MKIKLSHGSLTKRGPNYQLNFSKNKRQYRISTGLSDKQQAIIQAEKILSNYFRNSNLKTTRSWYPDKSQCGSWEDIVDYGKIGSKSWLKLIYSRAKERCKLKGIDFNLSFSDMENLALSTNGMCIVTQTPFSWQRPNNCNLPPYAPSLDRMDAKKGYSKDNCRFVCYSVNIALSDWGEEAFALIVDNWSKSLSI